MAAIRKDERFVKLFTSETCSESLGIPLGFNRYFPDPLPNTVELKVAHGRYWTVRLKKRGEQVFITHGWENFVKENNVEEGKWLNFIYDCDRTFFVIIFGHHGCSEVIDFPQVVVDAHDYDDGIREEENEEEEEEAHH